MQRYSGIGFAILVLLQIFSCSRDRHTTGEKLEGLHKYYFPDGKLYLEIHYKDSLPHGTIKRYNKDGTLIEEANYREGVLHGVTKMFHDNGNLSAIVPYDSGRINGVKKKYRKDGSPASEAPYHKGNACVGLVELFLSGRPVDNYPIIVVSKKNDGEKPEVTTFELSLSNQSKRVRFYEGKLTDNKYIGDTATPIKTSNGVGTVVHISSKGKLEAEFQAQKLNIIAKAKTALGNDYITQTTLDLSAKH